MKKLVFLSAAIVAASLSTPRAQAAGWHYYDPDCPIAMGGGKSMKFVAMQPKKNIDRECVSLPDAGPSVIVLDAADNDLRDMNWDIRILRSDGKKDSDPEADLVGKLPIQKYRNGMVNFDHDFQQPGIYVVYVKLVSDDGAKSYTGRHPLSVGIVTEEEFYLYVGFGVFAVAMSGVAFSLWRKGKLGFQIPKI